jgi:HPt (histidine-containing phosphotransfer) domain-containing protein
MDGFASKPVDWPQLSRELARVLALSTAASMPASTPAGAPAELYEARAALGLHVLNRAAGLRRWDGSEAAYQAALAHFIAEHSDDAQRFDALCASGDHAAIQALAHRARGVAANLGLEQLAQALADMEEQAERIEPGAAGIAALPTMLEPVLASAALHLAAALKAVRSQLKLQEKHGQHAAAAPAALAALALDIEAARRDAQRLLQSLRRGALDDAALASLSQRVQDHVPPSTLAQLHQAVADFDFSLAQDKLDAVMADALPPKPESTQ